LSTPGYFWDIGLGTVDRVPVPVAFLGNQQLENKVDHLLFANSTGRLQIAFFGPGFYCFFFLFHLVLDVKNFLISPDLFSDPAVTL
jgi:hypothetical protein